MHPYAICLEEILFHCIRNGVHTVPNPKCERRKLYDRKASWNLLATIPTLLFILIFCKVNSMKQIVNWKLHDALEPSIGSAKLQKYEFHRWISSYAAICGTAQQQLSFQVQGQVQSWRLVVLNILRWPQSEWFNAEYLVFFRIVISLPFWWGRRKKREKTVLLLVCSQMWELNRCDRRAVLHCQKWTFPDIQ